MQVESSFLRPLQAREPFDLGESRREHKIRGLRAMTLRLPFQQSVLQCWMHRKRLRGGFCLRALQNATTPPAVGMLDLKSVVFKLAVLPPQSHKLTTASPQCAIQKNQQLIPEFKLGQTELDLLRG